jgi:RimJ/RimL family protein N-acetyltransferase
MVAAPLGEVTTERLELRRLRPDDLDALSQIFADKAVWHYPHRRGLTGEETAAFLDQQIRHWDTLGFGLWLAVERTTGRTIGCLGLSVPTFLPEILPAVEVGRRLDPAVWGRGYATEGARAALEQAFATLGLDQVCSLIQVGNRPSIRVAERLGMRLAREVRAPAESRRGAVRDLMYVLTRPEWAVRARSRRLFAEASGAAGDTDPAVPAAVLALAGGRSLRLVWTNALGGMTFEFGYGPGRRFSQVVAAQRGDRPRRRGVADGVGCKLQPGAPRAAAAKRRRRDMARDCGAARRERGQ